MVQINRNEGLLRQINAHIYREVIHWWPFQLFIDLEYLTYISPQCVWHLMFVVKLDNWYILWSRLASQLLRYIRDDLIVMEVICFGWISGFRGSAQLSE